MGLDIYLYNGDLNLHFGDRADDPKDEWGSRTRKDWFNRPDRAHAKSQKYPEHYCERTYLRSSYNSSGFNHVVKNLVGEDWYSVFGTRITEGEATPHEDEDDEEGAGVATQRMTTAEVKAELDRALVRARAVTNALKAVKHPLNVMTEAPVMMFSTDKPTATEADALRLAAAALDRPVDPVIGGGYSNRDGIFFNDKPLEVVAIVRGVSSFRESALHIVYRFDLTWYIQACEIAEEFIEYALTLDDPRISWSS